MDQAITYWMNAAAGQYAVLDATMIWISKIGVPLMVFLCAIQWWMGGDRAHRRHVLIAAGLSFVIGLTLNQLILLFVHRVRPYDVGITHLIVERSADWSFPSDHATAAFAIVAAFALHGAISCALVFGVMALLVAWSRMFVGTHYLSDIVGGAATAFAAAIAVRWCYPPGTRLDRALTNFL